MQQERQTFGRTTATTRRRRRKEAIPVIVFAAFVLLGLAQFVNVNVYSNVVNSSQISLFSLITTAVEDTHQNATSGTENTRNDDSVLISLRRIDKRERMFRPGTYKFGPRHFLSLTGASITGDYHQQDMLWFQMFALGVDKVVKKKENGVANKCEFLVSNHSSQTNESDDDFPFKTWKEMEQETLFCQVGNRTARLFLVPSDGVDGNTNNLLQIWRCLLHGGGDKMEEEDQTSSLVSDLDFERFRIMDDNTIHEQDLALPIQILYQDPTSNNTEVLTKMYLPITEPSVGINRIRSKRKKSSPPTAQKPLLRQRYNMTLCVLSHANGILRLNEFLQYHQNVLGIDHIHVAVRSTGISSSNAEEQGVLRAANHILQSEIKEGKVTLSNLWDDSLGIHCREGDVPKAIFYQDCLYRAKSTSEFVGTWDLDEFLVLWKNFNQTTNTGTTQTLADMLRQIDHPKCPDWSFVTIKSSRAGRKKRGAVETGSVFEDYPVRDNATDLIWQKSISRTKNIFLNSFHIPGTALKQQQGQTKTNNNVMDAARLYPEDGECAFYLEEDEAVMVHFNHRVAVQEPIPNELHLMLQHDYEDR